MEPNVTVEGIPCTGCTVISNAGDEIECSNCTGGTPRASAVIVVSVDSLTSPEFDIIFAGLYLYYCVYFILHYFNLKCKDSPNAPTNVITNRGTTTCEITWNGDLTADSYPYIYLFINIIDLTPIKICSGDYS